MLYFCVFDILGSILKFEQNARYAVSIFSLAFSKLMLQCDVDLI